MNFMSARRKTIYEGGVVDETFATGPSLLRRNSDLDCRAPTASAVEYTLGLYPLGSGAVGAGQTAARRSLLHWRFQLFAAEVIERHRVRRSDHHGKGNLPVFAGNILAVLPDELLGGHLSVSATSGGGNILIDASVLGGVTGQRSVQGWGMIDTTLRASLGEIGPMLSHKISISQVLPSGRYNTGFIPFSA
jgi:hypothetical protein